MSFICYICEKSKSTGSTQRHHRGVAGKRWKDRAQKTSRTYKPNLQKVTLLFNNKKTQEKVCAKCIKRIKKYGSVKDYKNIAVA